MCVKTRAHQRTWSLCVTAAAGRHGAKCFLASACRNIGENGSAERHDDVALKFFGAWREGIFQRSMLVAIVATSTCAGARLSAAEAASWRAVAASLGHAAYMYARDRKYGGGSDLMLLYQS